MKVKAVKRFFDREVERIREDGEIFDVTSERRDAINATKFGILVKTLIVIDNPIENAEPTEAPTTVKDIKAVLDARGIEYRGNAKKEELLKLL